MGGEGPPFPFTKKTIVVPSVDSVIMQWTRFNECRLPEGNRSQVRETQNSEGQRAILWHYGNGRGESTIFHWQLHNVGHVWPNTDSTVPRSKIVEKFCGPPSAIIDTNTEIWQFFSNFS